MNIPDKNIFRPSGETLTRWLSTRKPELIIGDIPITGFFSDLGNSNDRRWFILGLIGELVGLLLIISGGLNLGGAAAGIAFISVCAFIFCDIFFATKLHRNKTNKVLLENIEFVYGKDKSKWGNEILEKYTQSSILIERGKVVDFILRLCILLIGLIKLMAIFLLGVFNSIIPYFFFLIIFGFIAYVHLYHTGYFLSYYYTQKAIDNEYSNVSRYANRDSKQIYFETTTPLTLSSNDDFKNGQPIYSIQKDGEGDNIYKYKLEIKSFITDDDISRIINHEKVDENKIILFKRCREFQQELTTINNHKKPIK